MNSNTRGLTVRLNHDDIREIEQAAGNDQSSFLREALRRGLMDMGVAISGEVKQRGGYQGRKSKPDTAPEVNPEAVPA